MLLLLSVKPSLSSQNASLSNVLLQETIISFLSPCKMLACLMICPYIIQLSIFQVSKATTNVSVLLSIIVHVCYSMSYTILCQLSNIPICVQ